MPNVFSQFGLGMQGANQAQLDEQRIEQQKQATATGQIGLEDLQRTQSVKAATRAAATNAYGAGKTISGSLLDMSDTAASMGDVATAQQYRDVHRTLEEMGAKEVVHAALTDPRPGDRPDLVQLMKGNERTKDVVAAQLDDKGNLTITRADKPPSAVNVGVLAERLGLVKPPTIHNIPAGGVGVVTGAGIDPTKPSSQIQTPKTFPEHPKEGYVVKTRKDADGNEVQQIIDVRPNSPTYGQEVAPEAAGMGGWTTGGANVRKDLAVLNDITKGVADLGDEYGKTDMTNPLNPRITLTPKGQQIAMVAEQIRLANQGLAPRTIIDIAATGKPMWKNEGGKRTGVVLYNGQEFPMSTPAGRALAATAARVTPPSATAPAPAAALTAKPGLEPTTKPAAPAGQPSADADIPEVGTIPPQDERSRIVRSRAAAIERERVRKIEDEMAKRQRVAEAFREIVASKRMNADDAWLIEQAIDAKDVAGKPLLTPDEMVKAKRMLAKLKPQGTGYKRGGKVTRYQAHGLE